MLHRLDGLKSMTVWRNIMTISSGSCCLHTVLFLNYTTSFKISRTIYQLTSWHNISKDFAVLQDNEPIHNSWKFQPSVSYCMMYLLMEPIHHQQSDQQVINRKVSGIDCGFIMAQSQHLVGQRNTLQPPNSPARKAHVLAKLLPRHLPNISLEHYHYTTLILRLYISWSHPPQVWTWFQGATSCSDSCRNA